MLFGHGIKATYFSTTFLLERKKVMNGFSIFIRVFVYMEKSS